VYCEIVGANVLFQTSFGYHLVYFISTLLQITIDNTMYNNSDFDLSVLCDRNLLPVLINL